MEEDKEQDYEDVEDEDDSKIRQFNTQEIKQELSKPDIKQRVDQILQTGNIAQYFQEEFFNLNKLLCKEDEDLENIDKESLKYIATSIALILGSCDLEATAKLLPQINMCGKEFGEEYMYYKCKTCSIDETSSMCYYCFEKEKHQGHDYTFSFGEFCCDCGDSTSFKPSGFCSKHFDSKGAKFELLPEYIQKHSSEVIEKIMGIILMYSEEEEGLKDVIDANMNIFMVLNKITKSLNFLVAKSLIKCDKSIINVKATLNENSTNFIALDIIILNATAKNSANVLKYLAEICNESKELAAYCRKTLLYNYVKILQNCYDADSSANLEFIKSQIFTTQDQFQEALSDTICVQQFIKGLQLAVEKAREGEIEYIDIVGQELETMFRWPHIYQKMAKLGIFGLYIDMFKVCQFKQSMSFSEWRAYADEEFRDENYLCNIHLIKSFNALMHCTLKEDKEFFWYLGGLIYSKIKEHMLYGYPERDNDSRIYILPLYNIWYQIIIKNIVLRIDKDRKECLSVNEIGELIFKLSEDSSKPEFEKVCIEIINMSCKMLLFYAEIKSGFYTKPLDTIEDIKYKLELFHHQLRRILGLLQILSGIITPPVLVEKMTQMLLLHEEDDRYEEYERCVLYLIEQLLCNDYINYYEICQLRIMDKKPIDPSEAAFIDDILSKLVVMEIFGVNTKNTQIFKLDISKIKNLLPSVVRTYQNISPIIERLLVQKGEYFSFNVDHLKLVNMFQNINYSKMIMTDVNLTTIKNECASKYYDPLAETHYQYNSLNLFNTINNKLIDQFIFSSSSLNSFIDTDVDDTTKIIILKIIKEYIFQPHTNTDLLKSFSNKMPKFCATLKEKNAIYSFSVDRILQKITDSINSTIPIEEVSKNSPKTNPKIKDMKAKIMAQFQSNNQNLLSKFKFEDEPKVQENNDTVYCSYCKQPTIPYSQTNKLCGRMVAFQPTNLFYNMLQSMNDEPTLSKFCTEYTNIINLQKSKMFCLSCSGCKHFVHYKCFLENRNAEFGYTKCHICGQLSFAFIPFLHPSNVGGDSVKLLEKCLMYFGSGNISGNIADIDNIEVKLYNIFQIIQLLCYYQIFCVGLLPFDSLMKEQALILHEVILLFFTQYSKPLNECKTMIIDSSSISPYQLLNKLMIKQYIDPTISIDYSKFLFPIFAHNQINKSAQMKDDIYRAFQQMHLIQFITGVTSDINIENYYSHFNIAPQTAEMAIKFSDLDLIAYKIYSFKPAQYLMGIHKNCSDLYENEYMKECSICKCFHSQKLLCFICGLQICGTIESLIDHSKKCEFGRGIGLSLSDGKTVYCSDAYYNDKKCAYKNRYGSTLDKLFTSKTPLDSAALREYTLHDIDLHKLVDIMLNGKQWNYVNLVDE